VKRAILTPWVDLLCCGGLSIPVALGFLLWAHFSPPEDVRFDFEAFVILSALVNYPHFMASYRLLYGSLANVRRHPWAALVVPAALVAVGLAGHLAADGASLVHGRVVATLGAVAAVYLAWHYTGQAWGMTASFLWIAGLRPEPLERMLIRSGYRLWLAWHAVWAVTMLRGTFPAAIEEPVLEVAGPLYDVLLVVALLSFLFGAAGFARLASRTGRVPPARAIVPWVAIYSWYLLIHVQPNALILVQLFHALQYLVFATRVDLNRHARRTAARPLAHVAFYYGTLLAMAALVYCVSLVPRSVDRDASLFATVLAFINIHHYFVDGCIWRIRNEEVRRDLFAHLPA
jgi:hypothetical protein